MIVFYANRGDRETVEGFADETPLNKMSVTDLQNLIYSTYKADVQAIKNLADTAAKLQAGGLTVPGNLAVKGNISGPTIDQILNSINSKYTELINKLNALDGKINSVNNTLQANINSVNNTLQGNINSVNNDIRNNFIPNNQKVIIQRSGTGHCLDGGMNGWDYHQWPCDKNNGYQLHHLVKV